MKIHAFVAAALSSVAIAVFAAAPSAGVPIKPHHANAMGSSLECKTCHEVAVPTQAPTDKACIACHGPIGSIPTKENADHKYPHQSPHYGDLVSCTSCHAEHRPSKAICTDCHIARFPNLK